MDGAPLFYQLHNGKSIDFRTSASADHPCGLLTRGFGPDRSPFFPAPIFRFALLAALARSACEPASRLKHDRRSVPDLFSARSGPNFFAAAFFRSARSLRSLASLSVRPAACAIAAPLGVSPSAQPLAPLPVRPFRLHGACWFRPLRHSRLSVRYVDRKGRQLKREETRTSAAGEEHDHEHSGAH